MREPRSPIVSMFGLARIVGEDDFPPEKSRGHGVLEHFQGCVRVIRSRTCSALVLKVCLLGHVT
jgi:hypothetical protein